MALAFLLEARRMQSMTSLLRASLLLIWTFTVCFLVWEHVVWRDEVRAMSLALQPGGVGSMLEGLGDGHPPLWYLLIRATHALIPRPEALQILATAIGVAAMTLVVFRSRFGLLLTALVLFSRFSLYEYSVMARNYGISMLVLFLLAMLYKKWRDRGVVLGLLLFLLADCNVHSVVLTGAFLAFWLGDILLEKRSDRKAALRTFVVNALIAAIGIGYAVLTVSHTFNDLVPKWRPDNFTVVKVISAIILPALSFADFSGPTKLMDLQGYISPWWIIAMSRLWTLAISAVMFGSILGLVRRPAAMVAAALALVALSLFFTLIYPGGYRHEALWLVFLLCMYWIAGQPDSRSQIETCGRVRPSVGSIGKAGLAALIVLLSLQVAAGVRRVVQAASGTYESQSRELAALISRTHGLHDAIVVADPDYLIESLPYYVANQTYLLREQRFGNVTWFTHHARVDISLAEILEDARALHAASGKPVIILLSQHLDPSHPATVVNESYAWQQTITPEQTQIFLASTRLIEQKNSRIDGDESYDAYILDH
jgi:hypothetical protein